MEILLCERINDANEYVELLSEAYVRGGHTVVFDVQNFLFSSYTPDVLHIQWPEAIFRWRHRLPSTTDTLNLIERRLTWYKTRGTTVIYTAHNLLPHETIDSAFERQVYKLMLSHADIILHHGKASIPLLVGAVPECRDAEHRVVPHGPYTVRAVSAKDARRTYGIPIGKWVLLNFGRQRKNKGPDFTTRVARTSRWQNGHLLTIGPRDSTSSGIAERAWHLLGSKVLRNALPVIDKIRRRTTLYRKFPHAEIPRIMAASDIVMLGHQQGLNSGVLALAASYAKPVIYPNLGNFSEQLDGWPWGEEYDAGDVSSAVNALSRLRTKLAGHTPGTLDLDNTEWLRRNAWQIQVKAVEAAVLARRRKSQ